MWLFAMKTGFLTTHYVLLQLDSEMLLNHLRIFLCFKGGAKEF